MLEFIYQGGPFMILIFVGASLLLILSGKKTYDVFAKPNSGEAKASGINIILFGGLMLLLLGILGTLIGLYSAFELISMATEISMSIVLMGFRIAMSTTIAGLVFLGIFASIWFMLRSKAN